MEKTIILVIIVVAILAAAGGAYMLLSQKQKPQTPTQPPQQQTPPQSQQQAGQQQQGQQQTGQQEQQQQQQEQQQQEQQQQEQQEQQVTFDQFVSKIAGKAYKVEGTFSGKTTSEGKTTTMEGLFAMAATEGKFKYYMKITESSQGNQGEFENIHIEQDDTVTLIFCGKSPQTENKWMCFKKTMPKGEEEQAGMGGAGGMGEQPTNKNPAEQWEEYKSRYTYEGLKNIKGVMLHCFYAHYQDQGTDIEERVCFDPQNSFFRYYWTKHVGSDGTSEWEMFIQKIYFTVSDQDFTPPATPQPFPSVPGYP